MNKSAVIFWLLLVILAVLVFLLVKHDQTQHDDEEPLTVYCAAGLQKPVRVVAANYERETGNRIRLNFAGSGVLESQMKVAGGDLYIPADESYIDRARAQGWVKDALPLTELRACIVVPNGNPKNIQTLDDLMKNGIHISVAETSAAVGQFVKSTLTQSGDWSNIEPQILVYKPTVNNVVEDVAIKAVDAGLAWDAVALQSPDVEVVRVPVFEKTPCWAMVGVLKGANNPAALRFAHYLAAEGKGREVFTRFGYVVPVKRALGFDWKKD